MSQRVLSSSFSYSEALLLSLACRSSLALNFSSSSSLSSRALAGYSQFFLPLSCCLSGMRRLSTSRRMSAYLLCSASRRLLSSTVLRLLSMSCWQGRSPFLSRSSWYRRFRSSSYSYFCLTRSSSYFWRADYSSYRLRVSAYSRVCVSSSQRFLLSSMILRLDCYSSRSRAACLASCRSRSTSSLQASSRSRSRALLERSSSCSLLRADSAKAAFLSYSKSLLELRNQFSLRYSMFLRCSWRRRSSPAARWCLMLLSSSSSARLTWRSFAACSATISAVTLSSSYSCRSSSACRFLSAFCSSCYTRWASTLDLRMPSSSCLLLRRQSCSLSCSNYAWQAAYSPNSRGSRFSQKTSRLISRQHLLLRPCSRQQSCLSVALKSLACRKRRRAPTPRAPLRRWSISAKASQGGINLICFRVTSRMRSLFSISTRSEMKCPSIYGEGGVSLVAGGSVFLLKGVISFRKSLLLMKPCLDQSNLSNISQSSLSLAAALSCRQSRMRWMVMVWWPAETWWKRARGWQVGELLSWVLMKSKTSSASQISSKKAARSSCSRLFINKIYLFQMVLLTDVHPIQITACSPSVMSAISSSSTAYGILMSLAHSVMISVFLTLPLAVMQLRMALHSSCSITRYLPLQSKMPERTPCCSSCLMRSTTSLVESLNLWERSSSRLSLAALRAARSCLLKASAFLRSSSSDCFSLPDSSTENRFTFHLLNSSSFLLRSSSLSCSITSSSFRLRYYYSLSRSSTSFSYLSLFSFCCQRQCSWAYFRYCFYFSFCYLRNFLRRSTPSSSLSSSLLSPPCQPDSELALVSTTPSPSFSSSLGSASLASSLRFCSSRSLASREVSCSISRLMLSLENLILQMAMSRPTTATTKSRSTNILQYMRNVVCPRYFTIK